MITYKELNEKAKIIENQCNLQHLEIYQRFMFERILERISVSSYNENFILKGGLLLSAMLGIESRSTRDMDVSIKGIDVSKEKMIHILNEILSINLGDGVTFELVNITNIREDDEYGGNKYQLIGKLENLKVIFLFFHFHLQKDVFFQIQCDMLQFLEKYLVHHGCNYR